MGEDWSFRLFDCNLIWGRKLRVVVRMKMYFLTDIKVDTEKWLLDMALVFDGAT